MLNAYSPSTTFQQTPTGRDKSDARCIGGHLRMIIPDPPAHDAYFKRDQIILLSSN